jgi:hypothetical protein
VARVAAGALVLFVAYLGPMGSVALGISGVLEGAWYVRQILVTAFLAVHAVGAFLITAREPAGGVRRGSVGKRLAAWVLRVCAVGPVLAVPLIWYLVFERGRFGYAFFLPLSYVLIVPCPALTMWRLRRLTCRVGRPKVAEHAAIAGCGLSGALAILLTMAVADVDWTPVIAGAFATVVVCYFWSVVLLLLVARGLRGAAREAREAWRAADASAAVEGAPVSGGGGEVLESRGQ